MDIILNILWCANGNSKLSSTLLLICQDFYQDFYLVDVKSQSYQVLYTWVGLLYDLGRTMCLLFPIRFSTCYNSIQSMVNWSCSGPDISNCHCSISLSFHIRVGSYVQGSSSFLCESLRRGYSICILMDCHTISTI